MEPIEFAIELWANPPSLVERAMILNYWRHLVDLGLSGAEAIHREPHFCRWNTATELYELFSERVDWLQRWSDRPWIPSEVVARSVTLYELMSSLAESEGERFWTNHALESDKSWGKIRTAAQTLASAVQPWVEAVGIRIDPKDPTEAEIDVTR